MVFDAPTKDWAGRRNAPTIDVYLYDIREDLRRRERGLINEYDERGRIVGRHLPPRHFKLSYLVTAWTQRPEDEHRLLVGAAAVLPAPRRDPADAARPARWPSSACRCRSPSRCRRRRTGRSPTSGRRSAASSSRRWTSWSRAHRHGQQSAAPPVTEPAADRPGPAAAGRSASGRRPADGRRARRRATAVRRTPPRRRRAGAADARGRAAATGLLALPARAGSAWSRTRIRALVAHAAAPTTRRPTTRSAGCTYRDEAVDRLLAAADDPCRATADAATDAGGCRGRRPRRRPVPRSAEPAIRLRAARGAAGLTAAGRRAAAGRAGPRPGQPVRAALRLPQRRRHPAARDLGLALGWPACRRRRRRPGPGCRRARR